MRDLSIEIVTIGDRLSDRSFEKINKGKADAGRTHAESVFLILDTESGFSTLVPLEGLSWSFVVPHPDNRRSTVKIQVIQLFASWISSRKCFAKIDSTFDRKWSEIAPKIKHPKSISCPIRIPHWKNPSWQNKRNYSHSAERELIRHLEGWSWEMKF